MKKMNLVFLFFQDKQTIVFKKKKIDPEKGASFHEKKDKNKKVNLGGPSKTKPRKTASRNRGVERKRDAKKKSK